MVCFNEDLWKALFQVRVSSVERLSKNVCAHEFLKELNFQPLCNNFNPFPESVVYSFCCTESCSYRFFNISACKDTRLLTSAFRQDPVLCILSPAIEIFDNQYSRRFSEGQVQVVFLSWRKHFQWRHTKARFTSSSRLPCSRKKLY